jgi:hypothetical protein
MAKMKIKEFVRKNQEGKLAKIQVFPLFCARFRGSFFMALFHHNFKTYLINVGGGMKKFFL